MKRVLILRGSQRKNGNTALMANEFRKGAEESGNKVVDIFLKEKNINDCLGCNGCQRNGGTCVQKDDMEEIYKAMLESDVIVFVSPVYFYTWTSTIKRVIDRTFAVENQLKNKDFYLLSAGAAPEEKFMKTMIDSFKLYVSCFRGENNNAKDILFGYGADENWNNGKEETLQKAYELGIKI